MAIDTHYKVMFSDTIQELAGSQNRSLLKELVGYESKQGELVFLDAMGPDDDATTTAMDSVNTRQAYEDGGGVSTFDEWLNLQTPHMEVQKQRTLASPNRIEWGYHFPNHQALAELGDAQSRTMQQAMKTVWKQEDILIKNGVSASSVQRGKNANDATAVTMPDAQTFELEVGTDGDSSADLEGSYNLSFLTRIREIFEENYADDERIIGLISPVHKRLLINNSDNKIHSSDFVTKQGLLEQGLLPDIYGINLVVHPLLGAEESYFFTPNGVIWNQFEGLATNLGESPEQRFHAVGYVSEWADCKRVDDKRVVQVSVKEGDSDFTG